ncbi:DUF4113 domain-containing protein [Rhizobium sp. CECT 9324]|uniref:DUF4113 domain-containing protein n=1 Tax=Rhizobium sp. CECT 9324 TaxID=2845820 RepID=UPI0033A07F8E
MARPATAHQDGPPFAAIERDDGPCPTGSCLRSERAWKGDQEGNGCAYTKAGIILDDLVPQEMAPVDLFAHEQAREGKVSAVLDSITRPMGKKTLIIASEASSGQVETKASMRSPSYTTRLADLPTVRA